MVEMYSLNHGPRAVIYAAHTVLQVCHLLPSIWAGGWCFYHRKIQACFCHYHLWFLAARTKGGDKMGGRGRGGAQVCMARNQRWQWQQQTCDFSAKKHHLPPASRLSIECHPPFLLNFVRNNLFMSVVTNFNLMFLAKQWVLICSPKDFM